jgi:2-iminobutanoate/2-iminopropanoate deaminase
MSDTLYLTLDELAVDTWPYSHAVADDRYVFLAGQLAQDDPAWRGRSGTIEEETAAALDLLAGVLARFGLDLGDVVRVGVFMTDLGEFDRMNAVYARYFPAGRRPARTCVGVAALLCGGRIEIDCVARRRQI